MGARPGTPKHRNGLPRGIARNDSRSFEPRFRGILIAVKIVISDYPPYFLDLDAPTVGCVEVVIDGILHWRF